MSGNIVRLIAKSRKGQNRLAEMKSRRFVKNLIGLNLQLAWKVMSVQARPPFADKAGPWFFVRPIIHENDLKTPEAYGYMAEGDLIARWVHADFDTDFEVQLLDEQPYPGDIVRNYQFRNLPCTIVENPWYVEGVDYSGNGVGVLEYCYDQQDAEMLLNHMKTYPQFGQLSIGRSTNGPGMNRLVAQAIGKN